MTGEKGGQLKGRGGEDKGKGNRDVSIRDLETGSDCGDCRYECETREKFGSQRRGYELFVGV